MTYFAQLQVSTGDIDPLYPVLTELQKGMDQEQALWHSLLYVAYYNIASSTVAFQSYPKPSAVRGSLASLPTGIERRGLRGGVPLARHTAALADAAFSYGGLRGWLEERFTGDPRQDWTVVQETLTTAWGNGRWAAYKTAEILMKVNGFSLQATDMGNAFSSGPRQGLALFYGPVIGNTSSAVGLLDEQGEDLRELVAGGGVELGIEQLETVLCDFHSMTEGHYYSGHDIDGLQEQLLAAEAAFPQHYSALAAVWQARRRAFSSVCLGEIAGWSGVDRRRNRVYRDRGLVLARWEALE